jgi:hypothetical protein
MARADLLTGVVEAVAAADGVEPEAVPPLHDHIDPEVLHRLDEHEGEGDWRFTFQFADHRVTVTHDSRILVDGRLHRSSTSTG